MGRTIRFPSGVPVASKFQLKNDKTPPELAELIDTCLATSGGTLVYAARSRPDLAAEGVQVLHQSYLNTHAENLRSRRLNFSGIQALELVS